MMQLHVSASDWASIPVISFEWQVRNIFNFLSRFCVPVFVMISGALFLDNRKVVDIKRLYRHNILRIVTAYFFWSLFYACFKMTINLFIEGVELDYSLVQSFIWDCIYGHYHMWFLPLIVGLYIITPFLREVSCKKSLTEYYIWLFFLFCICGNALKFIRFGNIVYTLICNANMSFIMSYTGYFVLGFYLHRYGVSKQLNRIINILAILSLSFIVVISYLYPVKLKEQINGLRDNLMPNTFFLSIAIFLLFKRIRFDRMKDKSIMLINRISKLTFGMYLVSDFFRMIIMQLGLSTVVFTPILAVPVITMLIFILSMFTTQVINKIPLLNKYII